jgi:endonuclease III
MPPAAEQIQFSLDFGHEQPIVLLRRRLLAAYGPQRRRRRPTPPEQFVNALISSETYDSESEKAFKALCEHFRPLDRLAESNRNEVLAHLSTVTHPERKAEHLIASIGRIVAQRGRFDLSHLASLSIKGAMEALETYQGIGPKCAAETLNFSTLRRRIFVVDCHIRRFGMRFGFLPVDVGFKRAHELMLRLMPSTWDADDLYELHWLVRRFGQDFCTHQRPPCHTCGLADLCRTAPESAKTALRARTQGRR